MTIRQVCDIKNNQLVINLPPDFKNAGKVLVTVDDVIDSVAEKLYRLKQAADDPLFLADMKEIKDDFEAIDHHNI